MHSEITPPHCACRANWARLIKKVYEVDPLECPNCGTTMRIIELIHDPAVIERILKHLNAWDPQPAFGQHNGRDLPRPANFSLPITYHPVPDIA